MYLLLKFPRNLNFLTPSSSSRLLKKGLAFCCSTNVIVTDSLDYNTRVFQVFPTRPFVCVLPGFWCLLFSQTLRKESYIAFVFRGNFYICEFSWNSLGCIIKKQVKSSNSSNLNGSKFVYLSVSMNMENHFLFARYDCVSNLKLFCVYFEGFVVASEDLSFIRTLFLRRWRLHFIVF